MKRKSDTVEIMGRKFLKCQQEDCKWNIGWLSGHDWIEEQGKGIRLCNLGAKAMIEADAIPPNHCQQPSKVVRMACNEFKL